MELQEAERDRYILERMDWDKNFRDSGDAGFELVINILEDACMGLMERLKDQ